MIPMKFFATLIKLLCIQYTYSSWLCFVMRKFCSCFCMRENGEITHWNWNPKQYKKVR